jgi:hypothetical protein
MTVEDQVRWLYERMHISGLLLRFARALDTKNWPAYINLYDDDGVLVLPWKTVIRSELASTLSTTLSGFQATHHISSNHVIDIDGDCARSNSYMQAVHVLKSGDTTTKWTAGGWYDNEYRKTAAGWKFTRVKLSVLWESGSRPTEDFSQPSG